MKLLINEPPLQVLPSLAKEIGLNEALFLQQLHYWMGASPHIRDGRKWIYNTVAGWEEQFPFWCGKTIRRTIISLKKKGLIETTSRFNKRAYDKTCWFAVDYAILAAMDVCLVAKASGQNVQTVAKASGQNVQTVAKASGQNVHIDVDKMSTPIPETIQRIESSSPLFAATSSASLHASTPKPADASPVRSRSTRKKADFSEQTWLTRWWCWAFALQTGGKYAFSAKSAGIIKGLLDSIDFVDVIERACAYLLLPKVKRFPKDGDPTLEGLRAMVNQLTTAFDAEVEAKAIRAGIFPGKDISELKYWTPWETDHGHADKPSQQRAAVAEQVPAAS